MSTGTLEIYRTESGSVYEVAGNRIRRTSVSGVNPWQEYRSINRLPASLFSPGEPGEVLEVVLGDGKRIFTSRLVLPFGQVDDLG
ncbi:hypothetical protein BH23ACT9_BH23ACT9_40200 [soil metagenome]